MHPADFCDYYTKASLFLIFLSNSALALSLGISYNIQRQEKALDLDLLVLGQGEVVQMITSSVIIVSLFFLSLYGVVPCRQFRVPNVVTFITLAALSMLGSCCLTTYSGGNPCCQSGGLQNPDCCRQPDTAFPLTWFSTAISLTGVVSSFVLAWFRPYDDESDGPHYPKNPALKMWKPSNGNDLERDQGEVQGFYPPPPYEFSPALLSSYVLPSIPLRKRDMNKLGLTVITDIPTGSPSMSPRKRWRGRGRDVWETKPLGVL